MSGNSLRHIAIIMDGNSRWAKERGKRASSGHKAGVEAIRDVMTACQRHGVEVLTLFAFSSENWQRPRPEVETLMSLFLTYLKKESKRLRDEGVQLKVVGNRERFSKKIQQSIDEAEALTAGGSTTLVIAADYGGRWDIAQAAARLADMVNDGQLCAKDIDEDALNKYMSLSEYPEPDLLIRTGGDHRISNFLLWQAAYSEFYFTDVYWPDFNAEQLDLAVADFHQRQRRFGKRED